MFNVKDVDQFSAVQCSAGRCNEVGCGAVQFSEVWCSAVQFSEGHSKGKGKQYRHVQE